MSTQHHSVLLSPVQVAVITEALGVCLNSDTFLDDSIAMGVAEVTLTFLENLP